MARHWATITIFVCSFFIAFVSNDVVCNETHLADVIFVLDSSASITDVDYTDQLQFVAQVTANFQLGPDNVRFGAVVFSQDAQKLFDLQDYSSHSELQEAILGAAHLKRGTDTAKALNFVYDQEMFGTKAGGRYNSTKILIIMTDGRSNSLEETVQAADRLKTNGVKFISIGIGSDIYLDELQQLAGDNASLFTVAGFSALQEIQDKVTIRTCQLPSLPPQDVVCNETHLADVIFVLDSSASITDADYTDQLQFVAQVTANFQLGPDNVRFGAVVFSQDAQKLFDLQDYSSHSELQEAILGAAHLKRGTDTAKALNFVYDQDMFGTKAGGRYNSTKILIIMTDGRSNSLEETVQAADRLKTNGVKFISIGIGSDIYLDELQQLAGDNASLFTVAGFSALQEIQDKVTIRTCQLPSLPPQDVVCNETHLADVIFVLDSSASITDADYTDQLQFVAQVTANFQLGPDNVRFGAVVFSQDTQKLFDLQDYSSHSELQEAILGAAHLKRGTDTAKALNFVYDQDMFGTKAGGRYNSTKILIIMTDGRSNSLEETVQAAERLKTNGVKFISIGIGSDIYLDELQQLAGDNASLFTVAGFSALQEIQDKVTIRTCQLPSLPPQDVVCNETHLADVIFVLDSSASITDADYTDQLQFVAQVTANFQLGPDNVRFGAVVFSQDTQKLFDLQDYSSHSELQEAILGAAHLKRGTDTAKALNFVYDQEMFGTKAGGRYNSTKILIIMTDGRSNSLEETVQAADRLKTNGVKFISIGIGSDIYLDELQQLAGDNASLFTVAGFSALQEIQDKVTIRTCQLPSKLAHVPHASELCSTYHWADGRHPNPYDCSTYALCQSRVTTVVHCGAAELYDPVRQACTDMSTAHRCDDPDYMQLVVTSAVGDSWTSQRVPALDTPTVCARYRLFDGLYPNPGSCSLFVQCSNLYSYQHSCPGGLHFSTATRACDHANVSAQL